ncbi:MAG TPA: N-acetylmuramoyl-L-alanine amidase [Nitrolancea sp.]|nr:N-acetylmuramoyl-L-alanine amidase [Nitrolancea sp.]
MDLSRPVLEILQSEAVYHVTKLWAWDWDGRPLYGDGLMYHLVIGPAGEKLLCRDIESVLWHCGAWPENATALAVHVPIGGDQRATAAQLRALVEVCDDWIAAGHGGRADVKGHQELSPTSCPGTLMTDFVWPFREGTRIMASGQWFPETGHYVGGGFWTYWQWRGGLALFGYPLTDERPERCEDGKVRTVQYFERAVFEYWPENPPAYQVLLRRLGVEALARVG